MKKLFLLLLFPIIFCGCDLENINLPKLVHEDYTIVVIDSCEYIRTYNHDVHYAHKGNCKFCAERRKREFLQMMSNQ